MRWIWEPNNEKKNSKNRIRRKLAVKRSRGLRDDSDRFPFHNDDMRYRYMTTDTKLQSNAVVVCIMDTSGSMGTIKKYLARSFYFLLFQFVRLKYHKFELVFQIWYLNQQILRTKQSAC
jgi:uncharacterized sporulation protein YeaH/YhbH (DUF444 family)